MKNGNLLQRIKTPVEVALDKLHAAGYRASHSGLWPDSVKVVVKKGLDGSKHFHVREVDQFLADNQVGPWLPGIRLTGGVDAPRRDRAGAPRVSTLHDSQGTSAVNALRDPVQAVEAANVVLKSVADSQMPTGKESVGTSSDHEFKNFHRLLCERFGYVHDEVHWKRDQLSVIEWIAKRCYPPSNM